MHRIGGVSFVPHGRNMNAIHIINPSQIVIGGGNESNDSLQEIFKSNDGGLNWEFSHNVFGPWVSSMAYKDAVNGFAVGYSGLILKTVNGATSFIQVSAPVNREFHKIIYTDSIYTFKNSL